jgi:deferrochelatase/peroxidase EfeB
MPPIVPPPLPAMPNPWPNVKTRVLSPGTASDAALLENIQGNILQSHGRRQAALIFWRYEKPTPPDESFWAVVSDRVTSASLQWKQAREKSLVPDSVFRSFAMTAAGMHALGVPDEKNGRAMLNNPSETETFAAFNAVTNPLPALPPDAPSWATQTIHGLWIVACENPAVLKAEVTTMRQWCASVGLAHTDDDVEELTTWWDPAKKLRREPFGFADGISGPTFVESASGPTVLGGAWATMPLTQVLIGRGMSIGERHLGGSFLVVHKFEQNVSAFRAFEDEMIKSKLLANVGAPADVCQEPGALLIGRHRDGEPLAVKKPNPGNIEPLNHFDFEGDRTEARCPFHAHIRKLNSRTSQPLNPRSPAPAGQMLLDAQIVRRGMIYDPAGKLKEPWPEKGVGLMFMAYASNLRGTFEQLFHDWAVNPKIPKTADNDPLLAGEGKPWRWPATGVTTAPTSLARFVTLMGGSYLYAPPICWLRSHAGLP